MLLLPRMWPLIFEQSAAVLPIYAAGSSLLVDQVEATPGLRVYRVDSDSQLSQALCGSLHPEIGLWIPDGIDDAVAGGQPIELQGYVCWSRRYQTSEMQVQLEQALSEALGQPTSIRLEGNFFYPPSDNVLAPGIAIMNGVVILLAMGIFLVPSLLFEEKQSKTMQALLVSPATIGQVVIGKALAGAFYILVAGLMIFGISWVEVVHWDIVILFVVGAGLFAVALGLVLGSFFDKQQDIAGWMAAVLLFLVAVMFVPMLGLAMPKTMASILAFVPSSALADICRAAFSEHFAAGRIIADIASVVAISLVLYALVIWRVQRSDR